MMPAINLLLLVTDENFVADNRRGTALDLTAIGPGPQQDHGDGDRDHHAKGDGDSHARTVVHSVHAALCARRPAAET